MSVNPYLKLPRSIQNVAITIRNCRQLWRKYGYIRGFAKSPPPKPNGKPIYWLCCLLENAKRSCPYYADVLPPIPKVTPDTPVEEVLHRISILSKQLFKKEAKSFISRKANRFNSQPFKTSGSTGTPIRGVISLKDLRARYTAIWRWFAPFGMCPAKRWARFIGADITADTNKGIARRDLINNHLFLSVYHLSEQSVNYYVEALRCFKPEILEGYPSAVAILARLMLSAGYDQLKIPAIFVTAETLLTEQVNVIERAFGTQPIDYYASNEFFTPLIAQGADGLMHLAPETGLVEVLGPEDRPVRAGEIGRMVVTSFHSNFMPLIRYDIGDLARVVSGGPSNLIVSEIVGRIDDMVLGSDGRHVGRLSTALKKLPHSVEMAQCRIKNSEVRLLYVASVILSETEFKPFVQSIRAKLGPVKVMFEKVNDIPVGPRGKRRSVIRKA